MDILELNRIRQKSKAKDSGPWVTDTNEMRKKTVLKRALKLYCDDPGLTRALEFDDVEYETDGQQPQKGQKASRSPLNDRLIPVASGRSQFAPEPPADEPFMAGASDVPPAQQHDDPNVQQMKVRFEIAATAEDVNRLYDEYAGPESIAPQEAIELAQPYREKALARLSGKVKGQKSLV
jgi:recombinational DNA repair protein RecT